MAVKLVCPNCDMAFSEEIRLERHLKKAHPSKRVTTSNLSSNFNHGDVNHMHFSL